MERELTLKEFKEAKEKLQKQIGEYVATTIMDFQNQTHVRVYGNIVIDWYIIQTEQGEERSSHLDVCVDLKSNLEQ